MSRISCYQLGLHSKFRREPTAIVRAPLESFRLS